MARLIDANELMDVIRQHEYRLATKQGSIDYGMFTLGIQQSVDEQPTVDAVPVEKYNELREAFVDYVCSGVNNQAPYCKNRIDGDCVDERGWCTYRHCRGFNPDGERKDGDGNG